jgi:CHRD domain-containing protein
VKLCAQLSVLAAALASIPSASSHQFRFSAPLSGADESTPNNSPAIGSALVTIDEDEITMRVQVSFSNLVGNVTGANVFAVTGQPLAGTAIPVTQDSTTEPPTTTLPDFPLGDSSGAYDRTINLQVESAYEPGFILTNGGTGFDRVSKAFGALVAGLNDREAYLNITTSAYPEGEIRGFPVYLPGDFNNDGIVDLTDDAVWRDTFGQTGEGLDADGNNSNDIDAADYTLWRDNLGRSRLDPALGRGGGATVPEPATIALLIAAIAPGMLSRRRR